MKKETSLNHETPPAAKPPVSGSFKGEDALERLIKKWYEESAKIEELTKPTESKHQRQVANHFLIQLYKCIGDAEVELKNCR